MGTRFATIFLAIFVLLAGCSGFFASPNATQATDPPITETATQSSPTTPSPTTGKIDIHVEGDALPVDPNLVWKRVQSLQGTSVEPPERIVVTGPNSYTETYSRFYRTMTGCGIQEFEWSEGGRVQSPDVVELYMSEETTDASIEAILAHEYAHVIQFRTNAASESPFSIRGALLQGGAIYIAEFYTRRYLNDTDVSATTGVRKFQRAAPCERLAFAQNFYGYRYFTHRIDSPRDLDEVYSNPPNTTEELIHNRSPGADPIPLVNQSVQVSSGSEWLLVGNATQGELTVRSVLWSHLNDSAVDLAASGWGNDRLLTFWNGSEYRHVWILRWDDDKNATEFQEALNRFLDERATLTQQGWVSDSAAFQTNRVGPDMVVVIAGGDEFVRATNVTGDNGAVSVTID